MNVINTEASPLESEETCPDSEPAAVSAISDQMNLFRRFQGSLLGALAGDCLGAVWEGCSYGLLRNRVIQLINESSMEIQSSGTVLVKLVSVET